MTMGFSEIVGNLLFLLLLVLANGFFVAAEFAIVKVRSTQIAQRLKSGHRGAGLAKHIVDHLDAYLSATQLGITLTSLGLGWAGEPILASMIEEPLGLLGIVDVRLVHAIAFSTSFSVLTFMHIVIGELAPKSLAIRYPESTTFFVSIPLQLFYRVFKPAIFALNGASNMFLRMVGIPPASTKELLHSPEELEMIVREGARTGVINETEKELITSIFEFSETLAKEIMVPRPDMVAIDHTITREELIRVVTEEGYSRMPVFRESVDDVLGIIHTKDLISLIEHRDLIVLDDIIRPAHFVPGTLKISKLLRDLQQKKVTMAIVVDEFGGTLGLVTIEDILEEIVGEIHDEYDEVMKEFEQVAQNATLVDGRVQIKDFNERFSEKFGTEIPEDGEYDTVGGFLFKVSGRIPENHEVIQYGNLQFTVTKKGQRRIRQVKVRRLTEDTGAGPAGQKP
jgi:CBS domain containing-hemolysin-like protein